MVGVITGQQQGLSRPIAAGTTGLQEHGAVGLVEQGDESAPGRRR